MRLVAPFPVGNADELRAGAKSASIAPATSRPMPSREQAERERSLLLLAEDHPINRTVLSLQLALIGFHVDLAEDGQEALAWPSRSKPLPQRAAPRPPTTGTHSTS